MRVPHGSRIGACGNPGKPGARVAIQARCLPSPSPPVAHCYSRQPSPFRPGAPAPRPSGAPRTRARLGPHSGPWRGFEADPEPKKGNSSLGKRAPQEAGAAAASGLSGVSLPLRPSLAAPGDQGSKCQPRVLQHPPTRRARQHCLAPGPRVLLPGPLPPRRGAAEPGTRPVRSRPSGNTGLAWPEPPL